MANQPEITTQPNHGDSVGELNGQPVPISYTLQNFFDDLIQKLNIQSFAATGIRLPSYTVATLPTVPDASEPSLIYVSDETGGAIPAFSDGTNWRRVTDRAVVS